jgi:PAS domain S-box-containing protein
MGSVAGVPETAEALGAVLDATSVGLLAVGPGGLVRVANVAATRLLQLAASPVGSRLADLPGMDSADLTKALHETARDGQPRSATVTGRTRLGKDIRLRAEVARVSVGNPDVVVTLEPAVGGTSGDTPAELFYQAFLDSRDAIEVTNRDGVLVDVNPAFERIYGFSRSECLGQRPNIVRSPKTSQAAYKRMWADLLDPSKGYWSGEVVNLDRSGREHTVLLTIDAVRGREGAITHFMGVATDLSEQRTLQLQAIRQERLASLGQLAAGVAHEINTPLANILLVAESIGRRSKDEWVLQRAETIAHQVESAAKIVRGLLEFARSHPPEVARADLVAIAHDAVEFLRGKQSADISVVEHHEVHELPVLVNRVQLLQVLVNLVNNASDAMDDRGELRIDSRSVDGWAEVSVTDRGTGISDEVLPHLYEPFFTTKPPGKGTGLGLSICHGIVQAHGGEITVRTEWGKGTTFTVRIPVAQESATDVP